MTLRLPTPIAPLAAHLLAPFRVTRHPEERRISFRRPFVRPFVRPSSSLLPPPSLTITTLPATRRDQAARIWTGLLDQTGIDELTTSWTWIATWLDTYGHVVPHRFLVATHDGAPVAITLATTGRGQRRGPLPVRTAHLGTAGERGGVYVEYNRILALPGHRPAALQAFTDALARPFGLVDYVELNGFAPEELAGWDAAGFTVDRRVCRVVDLEAIRASGKPPEQAFGGQIGRKLRKNTRWFTERYGPIAAEWITAPARGQAAFTELIDLHQARWVAAGEPGSFASERLVAFHRAMIDQLLPSGRVALVRVTAGDQLVGVSYAFNEHGSLNHYQWGLMDVGPDDGSLSPGFITALALIREGLERGFREVNWLGGDARWKRELSTTTRELIWAERPVSPWATAVRTAIAAKRVAAPLLAHRPSLHRPSLHRPSLHRPSLRRPSLRRPSLHRPSLHRPSLRHPEERRISFVRPFVRLFLHQVERRRDSFPLRPTPLLRRGWLRWTSLSSLAASATGRDGSRSFVPQDDGVVPRESRIQKPEILSLLEEAAS